MSSPSVSSSAQNPLVLNCQVEVKKVGTNFELTGVITGNNGKSYDVKVVAGSEAEARELFVNHRNRALAICEIVGKQIELSGNDFNTIKKAGAAKEKTIDAQYIEKKWDAIVQKETLLRDLNNLMVELSNGKTPENLLKMNDLLERAVELKLITSEEKADLVSKYNQKGKEEITAKLKEASEKIKSKHKKRQSAVSLYNAIITEGKRISSPELVAGELAPVPNDGIKAGCVNLGNSCWLNTSLKLMAAQTHFDPLLNAKFPEKKDDDSDELKNLRELVPYLKIAVNNLRMGKDVTRELSNSILIEIASARYVHGANQNEVNILSQHDGAEFLESLLSDWAKVKINGLEAYTKPITHDNEESQRPIITVQGLTKDADTVNMKPEGFFPDASRHDLIVNIQRNIVVDATWRNLFKSTSRCDASVPVTREEDEYMVTVSNQKYRVKGVMSQSGGSNSGHWVYMEVLPSGEVVRHSDMQVTPIKTDAERLKALQNGTVFYLEKVFQA